MADVGPSTLLPSGNSWGLSVGPGLKSLKEFHLGTHTSGPRAPEGSFGMARWGGIPGAREGGGDGRLGQGPLPPGAITEATRAGGRWGRAEAGLLGKCQPPGKASSVCCRAVGWRGAGASVSWYNYPGSAGRGTRGRDRAACACRKGVCEPCRVHGGLSYPHGRARPAARTWPRVLCMSVCLRVRVSAFLPGLFLTEQLCRDLPPAGACVCVNTRAHACPNAG